MASLPLSPWISRAPVASSSASLVFHAASSPASLSLARSSPRPPLLHCSFISSSSSSLSFPSSLLSGLLLGLELTSDVRARREKGRGLVVRAGKAALCQTKRNRSRKSLARTHGFRRRMRTTSGRAILKRRRAKGRKVLCTKSHPNSGK
ncbi:hypothetical protein HN51_030066 [Arachis hypogaea]|uniref:Large ribosomal subunit protein bL34c n=1 Tax=Arachis hypogaea TaxID=3818 RepID=A0A445BCJ2_ARAHY|nr:50S ribosomal protein L34, chloroplastic [Arachis hypogaea]QHO36225.1 50S ribosomal protein [Arachis hypogaea]RYR36404.1 hypothetical protein Ahy_A09g041360 [Arachis hypogaea]